MQMNLICLCNQMQDVNDSNRMIGCWRKELQRTEMDGGLSRWSESGSYVSERKLFSVQKSSCAIPCPHRNESKTTMILKKNVAETN